MRWFAFGLLIGITACASAAPGVVQTLDGRRLEGELHLTNDLLVVTSNGEESPVAVSNLLSASFSPRPTPGPAGGAGTGLLGYYFSTTNRQGNPLVRLDETIDFDWSIGAPAIGFAHDYFSAVWTGELEAPVTGEFQFTVMADEHAELWVNHERIADTVKLNKAPGVSNPIGLEAGKKYPLKLLYFDLIGNARVRLLWNGPGFARGIIPRERLYPGSLLSNHVAEVGANRGLLGTYSPDSEFGGGSTFTRVDPKIDFQWSNQDPAPGITRSNFSVRWSGQIQADHTEEYTFYTTSDERIRLWIDNKRLIDRPDQSWLLESKESLPLAAGEMYDIQIETHSRSGDAIAKLMWSSASVAKTNVPASNLFPSRPSSRDPLSGGGDKSPPGLLLRNGAYVAGIVGKASETSIRLSGLLKNNPVSTLNVSQIICQPLSKAMQARVIPGRAGVLLSKGDFVDGDFQSLENGRLRISSVLFGLRTFDAKQEVLAVSLRDVSPAPSNFEILLRDRSRLHADSVRLEVGALSVQAPLLGRIKIPSAELLSVQRTSSIAALPRD